jgi:hypothetical protein
MRQVKIYLIHMIQLKNTVTHEITAHNYRKLVFFQNQKNISQIIATSTKLTAPPATPISVEE